MKIFCSAAFLPIVNTAPTMQGKTSNNWKTFVLGGEAVSVFREISSKAKSIPLRTQTAETTRWFCVDVHTEMLETSQPAMKRSYFIVTIASDSCISQLLKSAGKTQSSPSMWLSKKPVPCERTQDSRWVIGWVIWNVTALSANSAVLISPKGSELPKGHSKQPLLLPQFPNGKQGEQRAAVSHIRLLGGKGVNQWVVHEQPFWLLPVSGIILFSLPCQKCEMNEKDWGKKIRLHSIYKNCVSHNLVISMYIGLDNSGERWFCASLWRCHCSVVGIFSHNVKLGAR